MKPIFDLNDLMVEQLRELYDIEVQLGAFSAELGGVASNELLKIALTKYHRIVNDNQIVLKQVFNDLFTRKRGERNEIIRLMELHTDQILKRCDSPELIDAAIVIGLQRIIHYKIASYGAVATYAKIQELFNEAAKLHSLVEIEKKSDRQLAILADGVINRQVELVKGVDS